MWVAGCARQETDSMYAGGFLFFIFKNRFLNSIIWSFIVEFIFKKISP